MFSVSVSSERIAVYLRHSGSMMSRITYITLNSFSWLPTRGRWLQWWVKELGFMHIWIHFPARISRTDGCRRRYYLADRPRIIVALNRSCYFWGTRDRSSVHSKKSTLRTVTNIMITSYFFIFEFPTIWYHDSSRQHWHTKHFFFRYISNLPFRMLSNWTMSLP